ncbi:MAG: hypothetical protein KO464_03665 [Candidatus Methanofastidiosum sp.]|nr:hypothetical protein [Methanofastidiosum sp.]
MKIPIEIHKSNDEKNSYKIKISLSHAIANNSLEKESFIIQSKYQEFIIKSLDIINKTQQNNKSRGNSILKWHLADNIYRFAKDLENKDFIFANITEALSRDLEISTRQINYLIEFRTTYPKLESINEKISWDKYKELLDINDNSFRKECESKLIKGEIKTRNQLRLIKKNKRY